MEIHVPVDADNLNSFIKLYKLIYISTAIPKSLSWVVTGPYLNKRVIGKTLLIAVQLAVTEINNLCERKRLQAEHKAKSAQIVTMHAARDKNEVLYLYKEKPYKRTDKSDYAIANDDHWYSIIRLDQTLLPDLKFEDGPIEVQLVITGK